MRGYYPRMSTQLILIILVAAGAGGVALGYFLRMIILLGKRGSMELQIRKMMLDAEEKAKGIAAEAEKRAEEKTRELGNEFKGRERDLKQTEERLVRKEELLDKRQMNLDTEQESIGKKNESLQKAKEEAEQIIRDQQEKLEKVANLSADEAKSE